MVAPFLGCTFGGFLYDVFIYTGPESPINTPWMGFKRIFRPDHAIKSRKERSKRARIEGMV
jgi:aquaglyceroporin related protein, other eukaryote